MTFVATYMVLAISGLMDAGYLIYAHFMREKKPLICPIGNCSKVTESRWSHIFGIRNEVLGFMFYGAVLMGTIATLIMPKFAPLIYYWLFIFCIAGLLFSVFLVGLQFLVIKEYCFYCLLSAFITLLLFLNSIVFVK